MKTRCCNTKKFYFDKEKVVCTNAHCSNFLGNTKCSDRISRGKIIVSSLALIFIMFSPCNYGSSYTLIPYKPVPKEKQSIKPLTLENVKEEIKLNGILCPDEVFAQIRIESGYLSSYLLRKTNNMLGMRYPYKRPTTASGIYIPQLDTIIKGDQEQLKKYRNYLSYAVFENWQDAIKDYKFWQMNSFNLNKIYLDFLKRNYAEDTCYTRKITHMIKKDREQSAMVN